MKSRHAAALALVSWYLIQPRYGLDGRLLDSAPLANWKIYDTYDSHEACAQVRNQMITIAREFMIDQEKRTELGGAPQAAVLLAASCVSSDDPRLNGK